MGEPDEKIGDPYKASPAVLGDDGPPGPEEGAVDDGPGAFEYPMRWGVPSLGEVIPTALRLWRETMGRTINLGLIAAVGSAFSIVVECFAAADPVVEESSLSSVAPAIQLLIGLPLSILCSTAACFAAADQLAFGRQRHGLPTLLRHALRFFWSYLGASFLMGLAIGAFLVPGAILWALDLSPISIAVFAACGVFAARLLVRWSFFGEAIFFEGRSLKSALDRSRELVIGSTWPVLGLVLLQALVTASAESVWPYLAPFVGPIPAAILSIAGAVFSLGFGAVWSFAIYAALRDRERAPTPP